MNLPSKVRREIDLGNTTRAKKINKMLHGMVPEDEVLREIRRLWPGEPVTGSVLNGTIMFQPPAPPLSPVKPIGPQLVIETPPPTIAFDGNYNKAVDEAIGKIAPNRIGLDTLDQVMHEVLILLQRSGIQLRGRLPAWVTVLGRIFYSGKIEAATDACLQSLWFIEGENVRTARLCAEMSQSQLGKAVVNMCPNMMPFPMSQEYISVIEVKGPTYMPKPLVEAFAAATKCQSNDLLSNTAAADYGHRYFGLPAPEASELVGIVLAPKSEAEQEAKREQDFHQAEAEEQERAIGHYRPGNEHLDKMMGEALQERKFDDGDREYEEVSDETWDAMAAATEAEEAAEIVTRAEVSLATPGSMTPFLRQAIASLTAMIDPLAKLEIDKDDQVANLKRTIERQTIVIEEQRATIRRLEDALLK